MLVPGSAAILAACCCGDSPAGCRRSQVQGKNSRNQDSRFEPLNHGAPPLPNPPFGMEEGRGEEASRFRGPRHRRRTHIGTMDRNTQAGCLCYYTVQLTKFAW
jgi:hypothetical protein